MGGRHFLEIYGHALYFNHTDKQRAGGISSQEVFNERISSERLDKPWIFLLRGIRETLPTTPDRKLMYILAEQNT